MRHEEASAGTRAVLHEESASYHAAEIQRRRLVPPAALVGLAAGVTGIGFRSALAFMENGRDRLINVLHSWGFSGWVVVVLYLTVGTAISVWMVRRWAPETAGSGIPHLKAVMFGMRDLSAVRVLLVKFLGGMIGIGSGLALGREGPTTQMGGALGQLLAEKLQLTTQERLTLIAAGAGAGLTAAFNAPIAGTIFVLEEIQRDFTPGVFAASLVATVVADTVARLLSGQVPVIATPVFNTPPLGAEIPFVVLGVMAGLLGVAYNRGLIKCLDLLAHASWSPAVVGLCVAVTAWFFPHLVGGGHHVLDHVFELSSVPVAFSTLVGIWLLRYVLTMISYGCGAPGGIFAPLLVLGALLGLGVGQVTHGLYPALQVPSQVYAVVGMAAYFTAIVRAPLTGIILIVEMTSNYNLTLPLLIASLVAYGVAEVLNEEPIYEALLERDLERTGHHSAIPETMEVTTTVQMGSAFDGRAVKDLGLPTGCVLVTVQRLSRSIVPDGQTVLQAGDRLIAVVSPQASSGLYHLRQGATG